MQTADQVGNFSINLEGTAIPTPALLPGLCGLAFGVLRKRNNEIVQEITEEV
ncbi:MAG: PTPA-CTERM sorting domain-containing protein [Leptolyngbyaceae cyanobacterium]